MSSLFALFLVTSLANILTPGLGVVMIITLAAEYGWRRTMSVSYTHLDVYKRQSSLSVSDL